ncbi:hypothetical protein [uncultured Sunxiuqinia sp.]|uniref:hypothetical protein n=1 Tax=uncultured Sunxiuqinia sp. TaxID=1573825 RepID=UPI00262778FA|nr:hypothetical protein [uncultured Sunxiuqinia sp.]
MVKIVPATVRILLCVASQLADKLRCEIVQQPGLLAIAVTGFDIWALVQGAVDMEKASGVDVAFENNLPAQYAVVRNELYKNGKLIEILVNYNPKLHYFAEWWKLLYF